MSVWWQDTYAIVSHPLLLPIVLSGLAGLLAYVFSRRAPLLSCIASLAASAAAFALTVRLFLSPAMMIEKPFVELHGITITLAMRSGALGALIAMGCAFFGLLVAVYSLASERHRAGEGRFHAFLCWTLTGAIGAALADDLIWLTLCWELVSLCLYMLLNNGRPEGAPGAAKTFAMIGFGDAGMVLATALIIATQGTTRISALTIEVSTPVTYVCYLLFMSAALAKAGAIPLHTWIPSAAGHACASVFALLPASLDKLLGIYLLARFSLSVFSLDVYMRSLLMIIGGVTILAAVLMAMLQHHLKTLLSFHAVSQVGYMVMGIGTGIPIGVIGGLFHMVNHAIYKSCLFLTAGTVEQETGTDDLNRLGGLARALPVTFVTCVISALAISGVPPLNGFASKWLVYQGCLQQGSLLALLCLVVAVFGSALTLASFFKVISSVFWGPALVGAGGRSEASASGVARIVPMVVLATLCVLLGVVAFWPLQTLIMPAVAELGMPLDGLATEGGQIEAASLGLWSPVPATVLILLGVFGGLLLYLIGKADHARVARVFIGGETRGDEANLKLAASGFYRTVEELPGLGQALRDGASGALDVYRLSGRYGERVVDVFRAQHTGILSLYVSWCLFGAVIIVAYLMLVL